ncbi:Protein unc-50-like protein, partial [Cucurbita argyrosperma subsp. argyrosperma]
NHFYPTFEEREREREREHCVFLPSFTRFLETHRRRREKQSVRKIRRSPSHQKNSSCHWTKKATRFEVHTDMLPTASRGRSSSSTSRANPMYLQYLRRIVKWQQMDIEYTFWQMLQLCTSPKVVYQHTKYHKQTKNQWARDDPAFVVICSLLLAVATLAYCAAYDHSASHATFVVISVLLSHLLITGAILATCCWLYAFDVHCNSFFPMFVLLYVIHYFISPLLVAHGFIPLLLSNLLFMIGASYYHYVNFLGYDVLPFLEKTTFFLYPIGVVFVLTPIFILIGFNPSRYFMNMYFSRNL